jgi:DNA (cytosine-5)-methyltransferase 1
MKKLKIGELFCGPGGIALGAELANKSAKKLGYEFEHAWAVDNHQETTETYIANISGATQNSVICGDVRKIKPSELARISKIDGFAYGFPCNDFSLVGQHKGITGEYGPLYTYGISILEMFKPLFFVAENVGGIRSANEGSAFKTILSDLERAGPGYILTPHLYKFEEYGVPQSRHRVIIVGIRRDLNLTFHPPTPTTQQKQRTCFEAITTPPIKASAQNHEYTRQSESVIERLKHIKPGENAWTASLPARLRLNVSKTKISQIYKRLDPNKPAYTVTGSGGGGTHVYHWSENRALTNRERARLQTFPDNFIFRGGKEGVRRQIGMAVPPLAAKFIFEAIIKTLAKKEYRSIDSNLS